MSNFRSMLAKVLLCCFIFSSLPTQALAEIYVEPQIPQVEEVSQSEKKSEGKILKEVEEKREENIKHFLKDYNTYEAVVYPSPVHYKENGKWQDIDNSLQETKDYNGNDVLENKKNDYKVIIGKKSNSEKLVQIKKDKYELSWNIINAPKDSKKVENTLIQGEDSITSEANAGTTGESNLANESEVSSESEASEEAIIDESTAAGSEEIDNNIVSVKDVSQKTWEGKSLTENEEKTVLKNINSKVKYENIKEGVSLEYEIKSKTVKESIVLDNKIENPIFKFNVNVKNLLAVLNEDKSISFYDDKDNSKLVYTMSSPFMFDTKGEISTELEIILDKNNNGYTLTLQPNKEWLDAAERVYPVVIDPSVETSKDINDIRDSYVSSGLPSTNYGGVEFLQVGKGTTTQTNRAYISFDLPEIESSNIITGAELHLWLNQANSTPVQIDVHKVKAPWSSSTITWNNKPDYNTKIEDYKIVSGGAGGYPFVWDITSIAKEWTSTGQNNGLMVKNHNESTGYNQFISSDSASGLTEGRPHVVISYTDSTGLEGYWTYHSQDIGRAGTSYVNDYNGNLIFVHNDLSMNGSKMPISLSHIFNSNDKNSPSIGYGNGWRLNLSQRISLDTTTQKYIYIDEDGTDHYLAYNSTESVYKDESGLDITMTINSASTNERYTIKDKGDNKLIFTSGGYLYKIVDNNGNTATLSYNGVVLKSITDGAGRITTLDVNVSGYLIGIIDPSNRRTSFAYNGTKLSKITYPDGKYSTYTYNANNNLEYVTNFDGYKMRYIYYDVFPYRVKQIIETNKDNTPGEGINIVYGYNSTTYNDHRGKKEIYQFNDYGNTISIRDDEGNALYYDYNVSPQLKNKLSLGSKLQKSIMNYLKNHNAEIVGNWTAVNDGNTNGSSTYDTTIKYLGAQSLKTEKVDNLKRRFHKQQVTLTKGNTYTLSAYIKTDNVSKDNKKGAAVFVTYQDETGATKTEYSNYVSGSNDWEREEVTFTLPKDSTSNVVEVNVGIVDESGAAYFDAIQLEDGALANRYNMLENPNFIYGTSTPEFWSKNPYTDSNDTLVTSSDSSYPIKLDNSKKVFRINGSASLNKNIYQKINQSGNAGDVFVVSGWAKGDSVPLSSGRYFALDVGIEKLDGTYEWKVIPFNQDSTEWQYASKKIVTGASYKSITFYALYYGNENTAYFDGLQLYKEEFGQSYQYDSKGNLISTEDLAKQKSQFEYSGSNDLIKSTNINGGEFKYTYDTKHNIKTATSAENVKYSFEYDSSGNPTKSAIGETNGITIQSSSVYTPDGNYLSELEDSSGNKVSYNYDTTKGNLVKTTDARGNSIFYSYDSMDRLTQVETKGVEVFPLTGNAIGTKGTTPYINNAIFANDENGKSVLNAVDNKKLIYSLGLGLNSGTMATWVKPGTSDTSRYILDSQGTSSSILSMYLDTSNKLNLAVRNSDNTWNTVIPGTDTVAAGTWNYVAFTWSKSADDKLTFNLYLNNNVYTKTDIDAATIKNFAGATTSLGMHNNGAFSVNGLMDQFVYSGSALTKAEIDSMRNAGRGNYNGIAGIKNTYTYENDKIKTVNHNDVTYTFNYDGADNNTGVNVGSQNLITNVFQDRTRLLQSSTYGNGGAVSYQYDSEDRISETFVKEASDTEYTKKASYEYDANGNLGFLKDLLNKVDYRYLYDASDRLVKVKESTGNVMTYNYDKGSNLSTFQEKVNGSGYTTSYDYDKDNRITDIYYKNPLMNGEGTEYFPLNNSTIGSRGTKPYSITGESYAKDTTITDTKVTQKRVFTTSSSIKVLYDLGVKQNQGTMGVWFNTTGETTNRYILASEGKDNAILSMYIDTNNYLNLAVRKKGTIENPVGEWFILAKSTDVIGINTWYYGGYTWSISETTLNVTLYLNKNSYTASTTNFKDFTGAKTALGGTNSGANQLNGQLEGLSVYNKALTSTEVNAIYTAGRSNKVNFKYDNLGRLTDRTLNTGGAVNFTTKYSFQAGADANTTTTKVSELDNNGSKILYTYDPNGNIETITEDGKVIKYTYDGLNQLTREDNKVLDKTITYTYDAGGNILSKTEYAYTTGTLGEATSTVSYGYTDTNWKDKLTNFGGKTITYDAIGNPKTYDNYTFTWEQGRQLAGIDGNGKDIDFKYNVDGIRTEKTVDGVTTKYRLVGDKVTFEDNGTDKIYYTYDASNDLVSMNLNGVEYWYIRNAQGDIIGLYDKDGTEVVKYTYDSWGKLISTTGTHASTVGEKNPYRYRGYRYDTETGLYYLQSRYYNAEWGRFINADALAGNGSLLSHNLYAYCENNSPNMVDPSGFVVETVFDIYSIGWSIHDLIKVPSLVNFGFLLWDLGAVAIPFLPGSYTVKGGKILIKIASKVDELKKGIGLTLGSYKSLRKVYKGIKGIEIHHLIEKRFAKILGISKNAILSIPLTKDLHQIITNRWRKAIPYGKTPTYNELMRAVDKVYYDMPELLNEIKSWLRRSK